MDIKTAIILARRHLVGTVVIILLSSGAISATGWKLWSEYKQLEEKREALDDSERRLSSERIAFEKYRSDVNAALDKEKLEVEKREFFVSQLEKENKTELATIQERQKEYSEAFDKIQSQQATLGQVELQKSADARMDQLMSEFSALGVSLRQEVNCNDPAAIAKYNRAKAKYDEIAAFANAHNLQSRYQEFLFQQDQGPVVHLCF